MRGYFLIYGVRQSRFDRMARFFTRDWPLAVQAVWKETLIIAAIIIVIAVYILRWLYQRSTKDTAFVRTGFGGEKVVVNGGAFVIPVLHETTPVNMNVLRIDVARRESHGLITKNRMRVDVEAEFFVRVGSSREAVSSAAQTLSRRTLDLAGMRELLE
eukprot:gene20782-26647_t